MAVESALNILMLAWSELKRQVQTNAYVFK